MKLIKVQYIGRHGTRYPTLSDMEKIRRLLSNLDVPASWILPDLIDDQNSAQLAAAGHLEMYQLGQRAAKHYHHLLNSTVFLSSESARCIDSAMAFMSGLGNTSSLNVIPRNHDTTLAMKYSCPLWSHYRQQVSADIHHNVDIFDNLHGTRIQSHVRHRLGTLLSMEDIATVYKLCGYDLALYDDANRWCSLVDHQMSFWLELRNDIRYSRVYGPDGADINKHIACSLVTELFNELDMHRNITGSFRFAHAETIMFLSTLMHLERSLGTTSQPITGNMGLEAAQKRGFRTSSLVPFAANIIFELYQGSGNQLLVRVLVNEQPIRLAQCHGSDFCPLDKLRKALGSDVGCRFEGVCSLLNI
ncbi:hypothetical protein FBU59_001702 [Linderina macrospora]|uniref:Uncharacterized protein n=1 Tax=Linderina macrospora TaxID=4868 RepID=A0ACC1JDJ6_9FUNG|nr:hypothetical protein FBU59_001702 [Linderina macrospora]